MYSEDEIITILHSLSIRPSKDKGQNFLFDLGALGSILDFGKPQSDENILEIGPGLGVLTEELVGFEKFQVVELEQKFCEFLKRKYPNLQINNLSILDFNFLQSKEKWTIFANLPYSISSPVILKLIDNYQNLKRAVLLLQKEFAERLFAVPDTRDYGSLSVQIQLIANVKAGPIISGDCFYPSASIESQVIEIEFLEKPKYIVEDKAFFDKLVRAAFSQRRKKIVGTISGQLKIPAEQIRKQLENIGVSADSRAENLTLEDYVKLSNSIGK
jgi:16S rRNA (adenine1518-N6/adenine1519-N6)-dimethyltransferase